MRRMRKLLASSMIATSIAVGGLFATSVPANAGPFVTIYPNYGNGHCGPGGWVRAVQVSAFPGTTNVYRPQNWAPVQASSYASTTIVANVWCAYPWSKSGSSFKVVQRNIPSVQPNKSYYF